MQNSNGKIYDQKLVLWKRFFASLRLRGGEKRIRDLAGDEESEDSEFRRKRRMPTTGDGAGIKMMKKMGYHGGGLGAKGQGIQEAVHLNQSQYWRTGVGIGDRAASEPFRDDFLFSDSSDMADTRMFGPGQFSWKRKMEWKARVDKALGVEKTRKKKDFRKNLDPNDDQMMNEFITEFDMKYGNVSDSPTAFETSTKTSNRTDWKSLDRMTRRRAGLRGSGEGKHAVSSQQRKKDRKSTNIFDLRSRHREQVRAQEEEAFSEIEEAPNENDIKSKVRGEFFDPRVPQLNDLCDDANWAEMARDVYITKARHGKGLKGGESEAFDNMKDVAMEAERLMSSWHTSTRTKDTEIDQSHLVTSPMKSSSPPDSLQRKQPELLRMPGKEMRCGVAGLVESSAKASGAMQSRPAGQGKAHTSRSHGTRLNAQAADILAELQSAHLSPTDSDTAVHLRDDAERLAARKAPALARGANFRDDAGALRELLEQPADGPLRTAPRGGWVRWARAQVCEPDEPLRIGRALDSACIGGSSGDESRMRPVADETAAVSAEETWKGWDPVGDPVGCG
jgi:hypothetical protein